jgi:hypothetical protein
VEAARRIRPERVSVCLDFERACCASALAIGSPSKAFRCRAWSRDHRLFEPVTAQMEADVAVS